MAIVAIDVEAMTGDYILCINMKEKPQTHTPTYRLSANSNSSLISLPCTTHLLFSPSSSLPIVCVFFQSPFSSYSMHVFKGKSYFLCNKVNNLDLGA
jgi:hypothetical protein